MAYGITCEREEATHIWVCDSDGGVHVLCHVTSSKEQRMKWREVDGMMKEVHCGSEGLVCGVDNEGILNIRTDVTIDSPLGKKWKKTDCKVYKVTVGTKYIAIWNEENRILISHVGIVFSKDRRNLNWIEISDSLPKNLKHITLNYQDILYGITLSGEVYVCTGTQETKEDLKWQHVCKAPPLARRGGFLSSLLSGSQSVFGCVVPSNEHIWCIRNDLQEIWQLLFTEVVFGDKSTHKTSWNRFKFDKNKLTFTLISANPMDNSVLYAITDVGDTVFNLNLQQQNIEISELPFHGCGDIVLTSLSSCHVTGKSHDNEKVPTTPSLYPKLPKLDEHERGLCCENGDCSFCEKKSLSSPINPLTPPIIAIDPNEPDWDIQYKNELSSSIRQWKEGKRYSLPRIGPFSTPIQEKGSVEKGVVSEERGRRFAGRKRDREEECYSYLTSSVQVTPPAKRSAHKGDYDIITSSIINLFIAVLPRHELIDDIELMIIDPYQISHVSIIILYHVFMYNYHNL